MLHSLKKSLHKVTPTARARRSAELEDYRQRLSSIRTSLVYTSKQIDRVNKIWNGICTKQRTFAEHYYLSYPCETEDTYELAKEFNDGAQTTYDYFIRSTSPDATYLKIQEHVLVYLDEIKVIEDKYKEFDEVTSEAARYQAKADSIALKGKDEAKLARNFEKLDKFRERADELATEILQGQKITYAKHEMVFKAGLTSYWLANSKHIEIMTQSLKKTAAFARREEEEMLALDVAQLNVVSPSSDTSTIKSGKSAKSSSKSSKSTLKKSRSLKLSKSIKSLRSSKSIHSGKSKASSSSTPSSSKRNESRRNESMALSTPGRVGAQVAPKTIPMSPTSDMFNGTSTAGTTPTSAADTASPITEIDDETSAFSPTSD
eukprot:Plantae.Rhodophyta-Hildenbrandia_rubra.ctg7107.p2 GENE.Plantae.Rhodophyta-Hildenbrandia_rubra.ctg7107~~Plantae.Rhodophyta-Hildenbrandia_rubra.ctg7107.p2  ORF type:complete len:375 (+),score=86.41 Plantae.Rhodophyta-Hildenbrandia_rubra.ctg7107:4153-5277(+)